MTMNRISAKQRGMLGAELRRTGGYAAVAAVAVLAVVTMIGVAGAPAGSGNRALGMQTEPYGFGFDVPASIEEEFRRETVAVAPATGMYEEPELTVNHEVYG
jgi:hypothetical protein